MKSLKNLFLLVSCFLTLEMSAQFTLGIKGGYTNAWEEYGDVGLPEDAEIDVSGYNVSLLTYYKLGNHFQIGIEPGLVRRGAACIPGWNQGIDPIFNGDTKIFLNYLEAPLMVSGNINLFQERLVGFAKVGYGVSYLVSGKSETTLLGDIGGEVIEEPIILGNNSNLNRWDHGVYSGLGIGYNFAGYQIFFETDYFLGMTDADRFNTSKNRSVNLSIGCSVRL